MRSWRLTFAGVLVAVSLLALSGQAQLLDESKLEELLKLELDEAQQDMLEEYLDILEDLQDILVDYGDYLEESEEYDSGHRVPSLTVLRRNIDRGAYGDDPEKLLDDLYETVNDIKAVERQHRVEFNTNSPRCCRLPRSLRKELVIVAELVEDYTEKRATSLLSGEAIREYMEAAREYLEVLKDYEVLQDLDAEEIEALRRALEALDLAGKIQIDLDLDDLPEPEVIVVPTPPTPQVPPTVVRRPDRRGKVGARHTSSGSLHATDRDLPVVLKNPLGDIVVTGADVDVITASLKLEVASSSHAKEKKYLDQAILDMGDDGERYYVTVDLPRLSDHRTDLLNSSLIVEVPEGNVLECDNSFGRVSISDMAAAVMVHGENSQVEVRRVTGYVEVENSTGRVKLEEIEGKITVENSYGPIELADCRGSMMLDNEYSTISLRRNEGRVEIANSGFVEVIDHEGDVTIENAYGAVDIDEVDGSIVVRNAYQPISVSDVRGSAELENEFGEISAEDIGGSLTAITSNGPIYAETLDGPIDLSNDHGNISVTLSSSFRGGSSITSTDGTVKIAFLEQPDLVLDIMTVGGTISSSLPISVRTRGDAKSAELILGDGGERLELIGSNTAVIIQGR